MRSLTEAILYPGVCLLEATNVSVGRGTDTPFEIIGAPWIDALRLAVELKSARVPGVEFIPVNFTPTTSTHRGVRCGGVNLVITDRGKFNSVLTGLTLVSALFRLYGKSFDVDKTMRLLGNQQALDALKRGDLPADILRAGDAGMRDFLAGRQKALLYMR
jgi:uncharacterized protein YbbC (DUF1343 family)